MPKQASLQAATGDAPRIGISLDERTHYAHVRYAASEEAGVIWYDPRDGHEKITIPDAPEDDAVGVDDRHLIALQLHAKYGRCEIADPNDEWVLRRTYKTRATMERPADLPDKTYVTHVVATDEFDDVHAAREAAAEFSDVYADGEYRDAVAHRTDITTDSAQEVTADV